MFREGEPNNEEIFNKEEPTPENKPEVSIEEAADNFLDRIDSELSQRELKHDKKVLTGFKKWIGLTTVLGASLLAVGCGAEKSGFTDDAHKNVEQRLKLKQDEIKRMHENSRIIKQKGGYNKTETQKPGKDVKQGPSGRVSNPEDL